MAMANFKLLVRTARERGLLVWVDACRIFENALFIKAFEEGYGGSTIAEIAREMLSLADFCTMSFKKIYSHAGGGILVNRDSLGPIRKLSRRRTHSKICYSATSQTIFANGLAVLDRSIKRQGSEFE